MCLKHILRQIEPDSDNLRHDRSPMWILADPPWHTDAVGGRLHHVWVAPVLAGCRVSLHHTVECVHVSGLLSERGAPWPVWDPRVVAKTSKRARSSPCNTDFHDPDLSDRFHTSFSFSRIFEVVLLTSSVSHQRSASKLFILCDHGPQHAGHLVCQRNGGQHPWLAGQHSPQPGIFGRWSDPGPGDHGHRAND